MNFLYRCFVVVLLVLLYGLMLQGCSSSDVVQSFSAEERFEEGMQKFNDEDYLEAIQDFNAVLLQYPGSSVADDAQYYLAEARFHRGEYLLASYEYEALKQNMPASPFVPSATHKFGLCYYHLSPKPSLDQNHTKKAIDAFQNFLEYFPTHELAQDAETKIHELNNRLAKKDYETAILYMKMENYKAAILYFDIVLEKFHDSQYAEQAHIGKIEALIARKKYSDAKIEIEKFRSKFPGSEYKNTIQTLENQVVRNLNDQSLTSRYPIFDFLS